MVPIRRACNALESSRLPQLGRMERTRSGDLSASPPSSPLLATACRSRVKRSFVHRGVCQIFCQISFPHAQVAYAALTVVAVAALTVQFAMPGTRVVRLVGLGAVWMTLVPRALWLLPALPEPLTTAQCVTAASAYFALATACAGLTVMADLLDEIRA